MQVSTTKLSEILRWEDSFKWICTQNTRKEKWLQIFIGVNINFSVAVFNEITSIPENVEARQDTTAEEILRRWSNDILKPMFTIINSNGSRGAPSHPGTKKKTFLFVSQ